MKDIRDIDYRWEPERRYRLGTASTERYIIFVDAPPIEEPATASRSGSRSNNPATVADYFSCRVFLSCPRVVVGSFLLCSSRRRDGYDFLHMSHVPPNGVSVPFAAGFLTAMPASFRRRLRKFQQFPETGRPTTAAPYSAKTVPSGPMSNAEGTRLSMPRALPDWPRDTPLAYVDSGTLTGGCGTLSFDWMQMFNPTVSVDVVVNGTLRHTVTSGVQNVINHTGPLAINVGGKLHSPHSAARVAIQPGRHRQRRRGPPMAAARPNRRPCCSRPTPMQRRPRLQQRRPTRPSPPPNPTWTPSASGPPAFRRAPPSTPPPAPRPLISTFVWTPTAAQTGLHSVVFYAGDKDGTNSRAFSIEVTPIYPYYHYAEGLTGAALKAKLHEIISTGTRQLTDDQENDAMKVLHTDPANSNNVLLLYNPTSSVPKSAYNKDPRLEQGALLARIPRPGQPRPRPGRRPQPLRRRQGRQRPARQSLLRRKRSRRCRLPESRHQLRPRNQPRRQFLGAPAGLQGQRRPRHLLHGHALRRQRAQHLGPGFLRQPRPHQHHGHPDQPPPLARPGSPRRLRKQPQRNDLFHLSIQPEPLHRPPGMGRSKSGGPMPMAMA